MPLSAKLLKQCHRSAPVVLLVLTILHAFGVFCDALSPTAVTSSIQTFVISQICRLAFTLVSPYYLLRATRAIKRMEPSLRAGLLGDLLGINAILFVGDVLRLFWMSNEDYFINAHRHRDHGDLFRWLYYTVLISLTVIWTLIVMRMWDYQMSGQTWTFRRIPFCRRVREKVSIRPLETKFNVKPQGAPLRVF